MALPAAKLTDSKVRLVCTADPCVTPKESDDLGWIPRARANLSDGADIVVIRSATRHEYAEALDCKGATSALVHLAECGLVKVNEDGDPAAFLASVDMAALVALGAYVQDVCNGIDPSQRQRRIFGGDVDDDHDAPEDD